MTDYRLNITKSVQGVHSVQGEKSPTLHSRKPRRAWSCGVLCRVCRVLLRACAREIFFSFPYFSKTISHDTPPAHPAHPAQPALFVVCSCAGYNRTPAHPTQLLFLFKKMKNLIVCGKENVEAFRAEIKAAAPDFYNLAKELYSSGMISGLRGATFEHGPFSEQPAATILENQKNAATCDKCGKWQRDTIGDGTGIGQCLLNEQPALVKWPGTLACIKFEQTTWR